MAQQQGQGQYANPKLVSVDVTEFVRTRDALASAYLNLSTSFERALKAYLDHTQIVLNGDASLNVSSLLGPFSQLPNHAQMAQMALQQQNGTPAVKEEEEGDGKKKRKKRAYKPRDPDAPKRPLTAYFRYLGEVRPLISDEISKNPDKFKDVVGKPGDISRIATERWNAMSQDDQKPYKEAYEAEMPGYNAAMAKYNASRGLPINDNAAEGAENAPAEAKHAEEDAEKSSDDSSDDSSTDEEEAAPPPPAKTASPKKSALKKTKASAAPVQSFPSINTPEPAAAAPASSPTRKRKGETAAEGGKKRRKSKSKEDEVVASQDSPVASSPPAVEASGKKKKDKKKKKGGD